MTYRLACLSLLGAFALCATAGPSAAQDIAPVSSSSPVTQIEELYDLYRYPEDHPWAGLIADSGYFDVGLGAGVIANAEPEREDALAVTIVLKAYPFGKSWAVVSASRDGTSEITKTIADDPCSLASWPRRLSVFAGIGAVTGSGDDIEEPMYLAGISVDLAPQFALVVGVAVYEYDEMLMNGMRDRDAEVGLFVGVVLNVESALGLLNYRLSDTVPYGRSPGS